MTAESRYRADGTLVWQWRYTYDYDAIGNWTQRTRARWVLKADTAYFEPSEVTYRTITTY